MAKSLREVLSGSLTENELKRVRAFDIVGDIAVLKLPEELLPKKKLIGEGVLKVHRNVKTVLLQTTPVRGEFRTREFEVLAGEPRTKTIHRESGCEFKVDLARVYFSPRLAYERMRIARMVTEGEVVTNLFAGVGCYSIVLAKHSEVGKVYSIDKNPEAFRLMCENIRLNRVGGKVVPLLGDAGDVVKKGLEGKADRVLMPLPEFSRNFIDIAVSALKPEGGVIHFYDVGEEPDPFSPSIEFLSEKICKKKFKIKVLERRIIRSYAVRCYHVVLDLLLQR